MSGVFVETCTQNCDFVMVDIIHSPTTGSINFDDPASRTTTRKTLFVDTDADRKAKYHNTGVASPHLTFIDGL